MWHNTKICKSIDLSFVDKNSFANNTIGVAIILFYLLHVT